MLNTILGKKMKMGSAYVEGNRIPVTNIEAGPCVVTYIKKQDKDGYWAVQLGFGQRRIKTISKPLQGHLRGVIKDKQAPRFLREVRVDKEPDLKVGDIVNSSDLFKKGDIVSVSGKTKGKGFQGVVKRWHFAGGPKTHGQSDRQRAPGSIGQGTTPGRVYKGKHMAGRMGQDTKTIKNLMIVGVDKEKNEIAVSGSVPGSTGDFVIIKKLASGNLEELIHEVAQVQVSEEAGAEAEKDTDKEKTAEKPVETKEEDAKN